jgi:hypothetical protein
MSGVMINGCIGSRIGQPIDSRNVFEWNSLKREFDRTRLRRDCHDFEEPERISQKTAPAALIQKESPIGAKRNRQVEEEENRSGWWKGYGPKE